MRLSLGIWAVVLLAMVGAEAVERLGIDIPLSVQTRHFVRVGVPRGWPTADCVVVERAAVGKVLDYGAPAVAIELVDPEPFSEVTVNGEVTRIRHLGGIYDDYEYFFHGPFADATVEYTDIAGDRRSVAIRLGYPGLDTSTGTLIWHAQSRGSLTPGPITNVVMRFD